MRRSNLPQHAKVQAHVVVKLPAALRGREAARHEEDAATDDLHARIRGIAPVQVRHVVERDRSRRVLVAQLRSAAVAARGGFGPLLTQAPRPTRHRCYSMTPTRRDLPYRLPTALTFLTRFGFDPILLDNDPETGGGADGDILNDDVHNRLLERVSRGEFLALGRGDLP